MQNTQELVRSLLNEEGVINTHHPIFEYAKTQNEREDHAVTEVIETVFGDKIIEYMTFDEVIKNLKYLPYDTFEEFLYLMDAKAVTEFTLISKDNDDIIQGIAMAIVIEESKTNSGYETLQWVYDFNDRIQQDFLSKLVNKVADIYDESGNFEVPSQFLSFFTQYLSDAKIDTLQNMLNRVTMYVNGDDDRIIFDEDVEKSYIYTQLSRELSSLLHTSSYYNLAYEDKEVEEAYLKLVNAVAEMPA